MEEEEDGMDEEMKGETSAEWGARNRYVREGELGWF